MDDVRQAIFSRQSRAAVADGPLQSIRRRVEIASQVDRLKAIMGSLGELEEP